MKITLSALLLSVTACAVDPPDTLTTNPLDDDAVEAAAADDAIVLPIYDGAVHRLGRSSGLVDAERIVLEDGEIAIPLADLLGELTLAEFSAVDVTTHVDGDAIAIDVTPGLRVSRLADGGAYCSQWDVVVRYWADGTVQVFNRCREWVSL